MAIAMNANPLVSVVMATFNEPQSFVEGAISSILNQTHHNLELLIADDSTKEETSQTIDEWAKRDSRIVVIRKEQRMGFVNALNTALDIAKGDFIARMDGDDFSLPDRFEIQLKYAQAHPNIDVFGGDLIIVDENNVEKSERLYPTTPFAIWRRFLWRSPFAHPTIMFRRSIIDKGFRYNPEFKRAEDIDFLFRLYKNGYRFGNTGVKLLRYRVVGDLQNKRSKDQWIYNHRARTKNFIWCKPIFSTLSWIVSLAYMCIPSFIISSYYKRENTKKRLG